MPEVKDVRLWPSARRRKRKKSYTTKEKRRGKKKKNRYIPSPRGQSYKANFGINYIKNRLNKLNFTLNYINFDVIYAKKVL